MLVRPSRQRKRRVKSAVVDWYCRELSAQCCKLGGTSVSKDGERESKFLKVARILAEKPEFRNRFSVVCSDANSVPAAAVIT